LNTLRISNYHCAAMGALVVAIVGGGCGGEPIDPEYRVPESLESDREELRQLKSIPHVPALASWTSNRVPFHVESRIPSLSQFPCTQCHEKPLPAAAATQVEERTMHLDIEMQHAESGIMQCTTCHNAEQPDTLQFGGDKPVGMDHAYQLCNACHFQQARDWAGGAHGKRLAGWRGKRVVMNCTGCHDPHHPAFDVRWPAATPSIPRKADTR